MGSQTTASGSHPDTGQIAWTAYGTSLLVATTINGAGNSLTGIWRAPAGGGTARLLVGSPADLALRRRDATLDNATHFLVSPDGRYLATDPGNRFWVARLDGTGGRFLTVRGAVGGVISQYRWLAGSEGLAYVSLSTVGETSNFRSTLYTLQLETGRSRSVLTVVGPTSSEPMMDDLSLAPAFRCVACG